MITDAVIPLTLPNGRTECRFFQPMFLEKGYRYYVAVKECCIPYVWHNISETFKNNTFAYFEPNKYREEDRKEVTIMNGNHDCESLNYQMIKVFRVSDSEIPIYFSEPPGIPNRIAISLKEGYRIDFRGHKLSATLGFDEKVYTESDNIGDFPANIENDLLSVHIHCSLVKDTLYNDPISKRFLTGNVIYSFIPDGKINDWLIEKPNPLERHQIREEKIEEISLYITDQKNRPIDILGEDCIVKLEISSLKI